jgi:hypothetical protein
MIHRKVAMTPSDQALLPIRRRDESAAPGRCIETGQLETGITDKVKAAAPPRQE